MLFQRQQKIVGKKKFFHSKAHFYVGKNVANLFLVMMFSLNISAIRLFLTLLDRFFLCF
jgi:hypothetical protein